MKKSFSKRLPSAIVIGVMLISTLTLLQSAQAAVQRVKFQAANNYLIVEFLEDNLAHFELSGIEPGPEVEKSIFTTPQVAKTDYAGPTSFAQSGQGGNTLDTAAMKVVVNTGNLCVTVTDKVRNLELTTICPLNLAKNGQGLTIAPGGMQHVYGLGEQLVTPGSGRRRLDRPAAHVRATTSATRWWASAAAQRQCPVPGDVRHRRRTTPITPCSSTMSTSSVGTSPARPGRWRRSVIRSACM